MKTFQTQAVQAKGALGKQSGVEHVTAKKKTKAVKQFFGFSPKPPLYDAEMAAYVQGTDLTDGDDPEDGP